MNVCSKCGKENQDHYKFCLGCGSELESSSMSAVAPPPGRDPTGQQRSYEPPRASKPPVGELAGAPAASKRAPSSSEQSVPAARHSRPPTGKGEQLPAHFGARGEALSDLVAGSALAADSFGVAKTPAAHQIAFASPVNIDDLPPTEPPESADDAPAAGTCLSCGTSNPPTFIFCGNCGAHLAQPASSQTEEEAVGKAAQPPREVHRGLMALIRPDGSEGGTFYLYGDQVVIGRSSGAIFEHDGYLSPTHAQLTFQDGGVLLEDLGSLNGLFIKITDPEPLASGVIFRIGQELLRFDEILEPATLEDGTEIMGSPNPGYWGRLSVIMGPGEDGSAFPLLGEEMVLGRERGDILFSDDGYVSGTHAKIGISESAYLLTDLGSSNGTFLRLTEPRLVSAGSFLLLGQQLFRLDFA